MKKKILIGLSDRVLEQIDFLAAYRSQARSELIREALRIHLDAARATGIPVDPALSSTSFPSKVAG